MASLLRSLCFAIAMLGSWAPGSVSAEVSPLAAMPTAAKSKAPPPPPAKFDPATSKIHRSVGQLVFETKGGKLTATAWAMNDMFLITAAHVCAAMQSEAVEARKADFFELNYIDDSEQLKKYKPVGVAMMDTVMDVCILAAPKHPLVPLQIEDNYLLNVKRLDKILMIGAPVGFFPVMKDCYIASKNGTDMPANEKLNLQNYMLSTCETVPGYSGSPLISAKTGKVVGLVSGGVFLQGFLPDSALITYGPSSFHILELAGFLR